MFAEGVLARGSPKTFYTFSSTAPYIALSQAADHRTTLYPSATAGFLYNDQNNNLTTIAQYFYNGEGYSNADRKNNITTLTNLLTMLPAGTTKDTVLGAGKLAALFSGRHYGAASVSLSEIGGSDFSASILGIMNLSDTSGFVYPTVSWQIADYLKLSLFSLIFYGADDTEYGILAPYGPRPISIGLKLTAGTGNF